VAKPITSKFLFRSDWTLAANGGARVKLHEIRLRQKLRFKAAKLNYWRTKDKAEVDFVIEAGQRLIIDQIDLL